MEDEKGTLSKLKDDLASDSSIKSAEDLSVGDIVYVELDRNDGLVLNNGYPTRLKYIVVAGSKSNRKEIGVVLVNTANDYSDDPDWQSEQYLLRQSDYPSVLDYDSWLDCTDVKELLARKIKSKKGVVMGHLNDTDLNNVMSIINGSSFVDNHIKKVYGISEFVKHTN